jgi:hypothetical protein
VKATPPDTSTAACATEAAIREETKTAEEIFDNFIINTPQSFLG